MKALNHFPHGLAMVACIGLLLPHPAVWADESVVQKAPVLDIKLDQAGSFRGSMCTAEGTALPGAVVQLKRQGETVAQQTADAEGQFVMRPPQGGVYQLVAGPQAAHIRCWTGTAAPPHAQNRVQFIQGRVARGQGCTEPSCTTPGCDPCGGGVCGFLMNPLVIGTAIAAAIAIPLALDDDDDDDAS